MNERIALALAVLVIAACQRTPAEGRDLGSLRQGVAQGHTQNVNVVNTAGEPVPVVLPSGSALDVSVSNFPSTQTVNGSVTVAGVVALAGDTTVATTSAEETLELFSGTRPGVNEFQIYSPDVDVSAYRHVRVAAQLTCSSVLCSHDVIVFTRASITSYVLGSTTTSTLNQLFDTPGTSLWVVGACSPPCPNPTANAMSLVVFGRR